MVMSRDDYEYEQEQRRLEEERRKREEEMYAAAAAYAPAAAAAAPEAFTPPGETPPPVRQWNPPVSIPDQRQAPPEPDFTLPWTPTPTPPPDQQDIPDEPFLTPAPDARDLPDLSFTAPSNFLPSIDEISARNAGPTPAPEPFDIPFEPTPEPSSTPAPDPFTLADFTTTEPTPAPVADTFQPDFAAENAAAIDEAFSLFSLSRNRPAEGVEDVTTPEEPAAPTPLPPLPEDWGQSVREQNRPLIPPTTVESLANLPPLPYEQLGPEGEQLGYETAAARTLTEQVQQPVVTPELRQQAAAYLGQQFPDRAPEELNALLDSPEGQAALTESARGQTQASIDSLNDALAQRDYQQRADATYRQVRDQAAEPPKAPEPSGLQRVVRGVAEATRDVNPLGQVVSAASDLQRDIERLTGQEPSPVSIAQQGVSLVTKGGTTALETLLKPLSIPGHYGAEAYLQAFIHMPDRLLPAEERAFKQAMGGLSREQQMAIAPAWMSAWGDPQMKASIAEDIKNGVDPATINQRHSNLITSMGVSLFTDPLNVFAPFLHGTAVGALGLETATSRTVGQGLIMKNAMREYTPVADAVARNPLTTGLPKLTAAAKASAAERAGDTLANLAELRFAPAGGGNLDEIPTFLRTLAAEGGDATARQYFEGMSGFKALQDSRFLAPDVVKALDVPESGLSQALAREVYSGPSLAGRTSAERAAATKGVYASVEEKQADVIAALKDTARRAALEQVGLNPDNLPASIKAQQAYRQVQNLVFLQNVRYYTRNALGNITSLLTGQINPFMTPASIREYNATIGRTMRASEGFFGTLPGPESAVNVKAYNPISWLRRGQEGAGKIEAYHKEVAYVRGNQGIFRGRRLVAPDVGADTVADIFAANVAHGERARQTIQAARTPQELESLKIGAGTVPNVRLTSAAVMGENDIQTLPAQLRWQADRIVQRAANDAAFDGIAAIDKHLADYAASATRANFHSKTATTAADYRDLKAAYDALRSQGIPHAQARAQTVADFMERMVRDGRRGMAEREIEERMTRRFMPEWKQVQSQNNTLIRQWKDEWAKLADAAGNTPIGDPARSKAFAELEAFRARTRPALDQQLDANLETLLKKMRQAESGAGIGGPKVAQSFKTTDDMIAATEQRVADLRAQATPDATLLRDAEEALANLKGTAKLEGLGPLVPDAASVAAGSHAHDALWLEQLKERLPGAVREFTAGRGTWVAPDADGVRRWNGYIDTQKQQLLRDRLAADAGGRHLADWHLHNYSHVTSFDYLLRWLSPWELWSTRTLVKLPVQMFDHPEYFSKFQMLREQMDAVNHDLPAYLRQKVKIPAGFLPDWMADDVFTDIAKLALPTDLLDNFVQKNEQDEKVGRVRAAMQFLNVSPGPVADALLAMAPGNRKLWETQARNPLVDAWQAAASGARMVGLKDVPLRPGYTESDRKEALRQITLLATSENWDRDRWRAAVKDLNDHFTAGFQAKGIPFQNDDTRKAMDRAHIQTGAKSAMSMWLDVLAPTFQRDAETEMFKDGGLWDQLYALPKEQRNAFMDAHPILRNYMSTGLSQSQVNQKLALDEFYRTRDQNSKVYHDTLAALPAYGSDVDRSKAYEERRRKDEENAKNVLEKYPGATLPERDKDLADVLGDKIRSLPMARDSNGVKDGAAWVKQRDALVAGIADWNGTGGVMPDVSETQLAVEGQRLQAEVVHQLATGDLGTAIKHVYDESAAKGYEERTAAGAKAKTREEATRLKNGYVWTPPTPEQIADAILAGPHNPNWTRDAIIERVKQDGSLPKALMDHAELSREKREQQFLANFDPKSGVSSEPFYANKAAGIVIRSGDDWKKYQKATADDDEYDRRAAQKDPKTGRPIDPTYHAYDTRDRAWLLGGPVGESLWGLERDILTFALGPQDPTTGRNIGGGNPKGWNGSYTMPNGTKLTAYQALQAVNKMQSDLYASQHPDTAKFPSERANLAAVQTQAANQQARAARGGARAGTPRSTGRGTTSPRAPVDRGPDAPTVNWFKESNLTKAALLGTPASEGNPGRAPTDVREGWRLGLGMTPDAFARFIARNPDVNTAITEMERRHLSIFGPDADQNAVTRAVQEQALVVQEQLQAARAKETERRQGPPAQQTANLSEAWLKPQRLRAGGTDFDRAFRTGTAGLATEQKWAEFKAAHPDVAQAIAELQQQAGGLKTTDPEPDDSEQMSALYQKAAEVGGMITSAREADTTAATEQRDRDRTLAAGPPRGVTPNINDAWLRPQLLRAGNFDADKAFRTGTSTLTSPEKWAAFLGKHPEIATQIAALQSQANSLKSAEKAPDDYDALAALYDAANNVGSLIATAKQRDSIEERQKADDEREAKRQARIAQEDARRQGRQQQGGGGGGGGASVGRATGTRVYIPPHIGPDGTEVAGYWEDAGFVTPELVAEVRGIPEHNPRRRRRRKAAAG